MRDYKFQRGLLENLRSGKEGCYEDASIYTVLLDLIEGNGIETVEDALNLVKEDKYFSEK